MPVVPGSLAALLSLLRPAFSAPTFETFRALVVGFLGRVGEHTVCGMWQAARLAGRVHHSRAHDFFARARWCPDRLGLLALDLLVARFVGREGALTLAIDGTVFPRAGRKVHGAFWHHDASAAPDGRGFRFGNCFVVCGLVVRIPALGERAWCLPVLFRLWLPTPKPSPRVPSPRRRPSQPELAAELVALVAARYPERAIHVVGDAAFACRALAPAGERISLTSRLRRNAVLHGPKPPPSGRRGRPRVEGERLGTPAEIAAAEDGAWRRIALPGRGEIRALCVRGLWYSVFRERPVQVVLVRELQDREGYRIALVSTDVEADAATIVARYADRWSIEVAFQEAKHVLGVGEARNRVRRAVERTVPFGLLCQSLAVAWYALSADPAADVARRRRRAPWYRHKRDPAMLDILCALRRELVRAEFRAQAGRQRPAPQIRRTAWPTEKAAA
jgi:hypothetical protein